MSVRYAWSPGARYSGDVQRVGSELERIRRAAAGKLEPEAVVEHARSANSILHPLFEWDDKAAADAYRVSQAGDLIRAVHVDVTHSNIAEPKLIRAFVSVERDGERSYTSTLHAMSDAELRRQVVRQAFLDFEALRKKHAELSELAGIFEAIDQARTVL